jgi:hypothetical protein
MIQKAHDKPHRHEHEAQSDARPQDDADPKLRPEFFGLSRTFSSR